MEQIISVTTQVAISRRVHLYRILALMRDCQAARRQEEEAGRATATGVGW